MQSGSILTAGDGLDGLMGARRVQAGMNSKSKRVLAQLQWRWRQTRSKPETGNECAGQATGWNVGKGLPGGLRIGKKTATPCKISAIQYF